MISLSAYLGQHQIMGFFAGFLIGSMIGLALFAILAFTIAERR